MIITKTPFRMSFFGGGTDFEPFFCKHGGAVISTTFDKYCYVTVRHLPPFFDYSTQVSYSRMESVKDVSEIEHPLVREAMGFLDMHELRISYDADLPAGTGLGTSSAFAVGLLSAFHALKGQYASKRQLADEAIRLERVLCAESGGLQDQIAASFGGLNRIDFGPEGYSVRPIVLDKERKRELRSNLMLFFTGATRRSFEVSRAQEETAATEDFRLLRTLELVDEAERALVSRDRPLSDFGELLHEAWELKRGFHPGVSTDGVDEAYSAARKAGALGGKLLGAGGGGFLLVYAEEAARPAVREALSALVEVPFEFEEEGTSVLYFDPEDWVPGDHGCNENGKVCDD